MHNFNLHQSNEKKGSIDAQIDSYITSIKGMNNLKMSKAAMKNGCMEKDNVRGKTGFYPI